MLFRTRSPRRLSVVALMTLAVGWPTTSWPQTLVIPPHPLPGGAHVEFVVSAVRDGGEGDEIFQDSTQEGRFRFKVDPSGLDWVDPSHLQYGYFKFYVQRRNSRHIKWFKVSVVPSGSFQDGWTAVSFSISDQEKDASDRGQASLLLVSTNPPEGLTLVDEKEIRGIRLTGQSSLDLKLETATPDAALEVTVPQVVANQALWRTPVKRLSAGTGRVDKDHSTIVVTLAFEPNLGDALQQSLFSPQAGTAQASVPLVTNYHLVDFPSRSREFQRIVKLRFEPSPLSLPLALLMGFMVGSVIRLAGSLIGWKLSIRTTVASGSTTFVLWLLALVLIGLKSEFKLFGLTLDPFQVVHTFIFGAVGAVMGLATLDALKRLFNLA